jgi:hypothetical protein
MTAEYIQAVQDAIRHMHGCGSRHVATVPVLEAFQGKTVWQGDVEVFDLEGHPKARQCFPWGYQDDAGKWQYVAVLKISPADSPQNAVRAYIVSRKSP